VLSRKGEVKRQGRDSPRDTISMNILLMWKNQPKGRIETAGEKRVTGNQRKAGRGHSIFTEMMVWLANYQGPLPKHKEK